MSRRRRAFVAAWFVLVLLVLLLIALDQLGQAQR